MPSISLLLFPWLLHLHVNCLCSMVNNSCGEDSTNYYFPGFKTFLSRTIKNSTKYHSYLSFPKKERKVNKFKLIANYPDHGCFTGKNIFLSSSKCSCPGSLFIRTCWLPNPLYRSDLLHFSAQNSLKFLMWNSSILRAVKGRLQDFTLMLCATDRLLLSL